MSKYLVPEGGLKAAVDAMKNPPGIKFRFTEQWASLGLEAFIDWLAENPQVPTDEQVGKLLGSFLMDGRQSSGKTSDSVRGVIAEWQRRIFLAPEPEVPEAVKDLQWSKGAQDFEEHNEDVLEAYRRGLAAKERA